MLTLVLLVVLAGGAGLMAVGLIDGRGLSGLFGRFGLGSLRRTPRRGTTRPPRADAGEPRRDARVEPLVPAVSASQPMMEETSPPPTGAVAREAVDEPLDPLPAPPSSGRRGGKRVPAAYTAVEGTYRDVARVPLWRKLVSLVLLLGLLLVVGFAIAALAGATLGAVAELVDGAVG